MPDTTDNFSLATTIKLPGTVGGHGDWVTYDPATKTVWLAQSPDNNVVVIDARTNTIKATISGVANANGIALTSKYAFVADPNNNVVDVIDKRTYQIVGKTTPTGTTPDGVVYAPNTGKVYVASDDANVLDALNATPSFAQAASYPLTASSTGPDVPSYAKGFIYVPDGKVVDAVNPSTGSIVASPTLVSTGAVKPGVYDPRTDQFFFGTTDNAIEVVSGGDGPGGIGSVVSTISIAGSTDEAAIDVKSRLAFFGDKAGEVDVVNLDSKSVVATLPAETGMHTLTVDPQTHELYVYENNRNVVDVWSYGRGGSEDSFARLGPHNIGAGGDDRMSFHEGRHGSAPSHSDADDWQGGANALSASADITFGAAGGGCSAMRTGHETQGQQSGSLSLDQLAGTSAGDMLLPNMSQAT